MATYNFTGTAPSITITLNTETGKYPAEIYTFRASSAILSGGNIIITDYGIPQREFKFHEIGLIGVATPTDIADAYTKILAV